LGEAWNLEKLATDCRADGRYSTMLAVLPLPIPGAVGLAINHVAIKLASAVSADCADTADDASPGSDCGCMVQPNVDERRPFEVLEQCRHLLDVLQRAHLERARAERLSQRAQLRPPHEGVLGVLPVVAELGVLGPIRSIVEHDDKQRDAVPCG